MGLGVGEKLHYHQFSAGNVEQILRYGVGATARFLPGELSGAPVGGQSLAPAAGSLRIPRVT